MSSNKRAIFSLDWYVISARSVRQLTIVILGLALLVGTFYGAYRYLKSSAAFSATPGTQSARFIEISGSVRIKKANATDFITANEKMPLDAGDTIQTLSNAVARVQFVDGSSYTIKPDTTLVIKDNELMNDNRTKVQVNVRVGTINLATNEQGPGSSNVVKTEATETRVGENTEASVATGTDGAQADIRVTRGGAEIKSQTGEIYQAQSNERFEFEQAGKLARRSSLLGIPSLKSPGNQQMIRVENSSPIRFEWESISQASSYAIELATSSSFDRGTIVNLREGLASPTAVFDKLPLGSYYWRVRANQKNEQGVYSDPYKFTLVGGSSRQTTLTLKGLRKTALGGNTYLVEGRCETGARVKVEGRLARIEADGSFRAIVNLPAGTRRITVEAEDQDGNTGREVLQF